MSAADVAPRIARRFADLRAAGHPFPSLVDD